MCQKRNHKKKFKNNFELNEDTKTYGMQLKAVQRGKFMIQMLY